MKETPCVSHATGDLLLGTFKCIHGSLKEVKVFFQYEKMLKFIGKEIKCIHIKEDRDRYKTITCSDLSPFHSPDLALLSPRWQCLQERTV